MSVLRRAFRIVRAVPRRWRLPRYIGHWRPPDFFWHRSGGSCGEIEEGQVWEAAIFANAKKLSHLIAFVDYNKCQIDDYVQNLCAMGDIAKKFESFGWFAQNVEDGNDVEQIAAAIEKAKEQDERPSVIVLNTVKGKGYSKIEGTLGSHNMPVDAEMVQEANMIGTAAGLSSRGFIPFTHTFGPFAARRACDL